jgi:hypothetical protein
MMAFILGSGYEFEAVLHTAAKQFCKVCMMMFVGLWVRM